MATDCERYDALIAWLAGPAADPAASHEDRELSNKDIEWMMRHQDQCYNPEHNTANWRRQLEEMDARVASRFRKAFDNPAREERGEITEDSPHDWVVKVLSETDMQTTRPPDLIGRTYVFTYNLDADPAQERPEQCGTVVGTITGVAASVYPRGDGICQVLQLTSDEQRLFFLREGQEHLVRIVGLQIVSEESNIEPAGKKWRLVVTYPDRLPGYYEGIRGTLRILKKN